MSTGVKPDLKAVPKEEPKPLPKYEGKRRITIVIEDNGEEGNRGFNLFMDGDKERIGKVPDVELGPAEHWGSKLFMICVNAVRGSGVVKKETQRDEKPT